MFWHRDLRRLHDSRTETEYVQTYMDVASSSTSRSLLLLLAARSWPPWRRRAEGTALGLGHRAGHVAVRGGPRRQGVLRLRLRRDRGTQLKAGCGYATAGEVYLDKCYARF